MSTDTEHVEEGTETSVLETWERWYHIPVIGAVMLFMFWSRAQLYENFLTDDGRPALAAVDSWYHWRTIEWTAENYPRTMPYEIWTSFPSGRYVGQFGTLFDQLIVTAAMIVGLGDPSTETLYLVSLLAVPAMAALVAVPVFYMGRRLGGTIGGLVSVILLALAPGTFFIRSTAGMLQHHVAEVLFMAIAVLAMMVALRVAEREKPIYELLVDKDWDALREPLVYSALAGIGMGLYIWIWPPAVVLVGIFGVFFILALCIDYLRGVSPDHLAFVGATSFAVTAFIAILLIEEPGFSVTSFGYLQPTLAILGVGGFVSMAWLARQWDSRGIDKRYYPVAVLGMITVALAVMAVVLPDLFDRLVSEATGRIMPLDPADHRTTISEAQPPDSFPQHVFDEFGMAFYTMVAGLGLLAARPYFGREYRAEYTLMIVWALFLTSMAATQLRFAYYLVLPVAVVNAVFVADIVRLFDLDINAGVRSLREIETYQIITLVLVVMLLFAPLLPPLAAATAWDRGGSEAQVGPSPDGMLWEESNHWMNANTPEPGDWAGADNASELEYFGTYDYPDGGDYEYPVGAYGVISWWDYGHLITTQAERIPHSNPFQSNARSSSAFFTAQSEERGELILDAVATGESVDEQTDEELEAIVEDNDSHEEMRYVMIDYAMAGGKFNAITQWTGPDYYEYATPEGYQAGEPLTVDDLESFSYDDTMLADLYFSDANEMEHYRLVHEDERQSGFISYAIVQGDQVLQNDDGEPQITVNREITPDLQGELSQIEAHPEFDLVELDQRQAAAVKSFERVEGATITGHVDDQSVIDDENATVFAGVDMETNAERSFTYTQTAEIADDGTFELPVSYASEEELDVEDGYTDSSVTALDDYTVVVATEGDDGFEALYEGQTEVPETAVIDGETVEVTLEESADDDAVDEVEDDEEAPEEVDEDDIDDSETEEEDVADNDTVDSLASIAPEGVN